MNLILNFFSEFLAGRCGSVVVQLIVSGSAKLVYRLEYTPLMDGPFP